MLLFRWKTLESALKAMATVEGSSNNKQDLHWFENPVGYIVRQYFPGTGPTEKDIEQKMVELLALKRTQK